VGRPVSFPKGTILFDHDSGSRRIYLLRAGDVRLTSRDEAILDYLTPGSFLGEKSLLGAPSGSQTATALTPVDTIAFRQTELLAEMKRDPRFALRLLKDMAQRLDRYEETIRDLVAAQADVRLARLLLRHAPSRQRAAWVRLPIAFTNLELAKMVGTTRWRISHLLNRFHKLGWLRRDDGLWVQREGLRAFLAQKA
jgi:CRP-like cAMP-binding protein